ncbi:dehydrogenase [Burkholderia contaminans FFH2055]|uniref:SDR family NAD(P)-dependent oxidoreductase n=1 Tax=Burkholderia contaminans TaxID=488447 RepID=A0A0G3Z323_9BURK|nr:MULTISPECIES: oxidoreductase [Burkholderia]AKM44749.1 dehydrogenase [Burkholderia contaminans]AOL09057.1 dehydrogenase [Burkholderia contaminans]ELK6461431.1 SDR family NAD(P)-dependent oxidoreductase [Burkholderia contaminans]KKL35212.1 dehydrogenase [Burkholderia contaminans FFH2055]MCA7884956.1 SDR family NAD(P)-dependent oxidoreductase [Burkholderia contaminans]
MNKTWLITGCSGGFGLHLARAAAERGDHVVATARAPETLRDLARRYPDTLRVAALDVTKPETIHAAIALTTETFGRLDVLVNNAGHGFMGAIEEGTPDEYRPLFDVNVFGLIETTRAALPLMRRTGGGRIVNLSSGAGIAGSGGRGYYNATKFAVEGLSEALAQEVEPMGIRVVIVEPGPFRTEFLGRSIAVAKQQIGDYSATAGSARNYRDSNDGHQAGDPAKAAAVIIQAIDSDDPPLHLPIGPSAHAIAERKLKAFRQDIDAWRARSIATDFD